MPNDVNISGDEGGQEVLGQGASVGYFIGFFLHTLDVKKRLTVPLIWRGQVGDPQSLFVTAVHTNRLYVLPSREIIRRLEKQGAHSITDVEMMLSDRMLGANSELLNWDSQGRIRIRDDLLAHAGLSEQVAMVGGFRHFEIWDSKAWDKVRKDEPLDPSDHARRLGL